MKRIITVIFAVLLALPFSFSVSAEDFSESSVHIEFSVSDVSNDSSYITSEISDITENSKATEENEKPAGKVSKDPQIPSTTGRMIVDPFEEKEGISTGTIVIIVLIVILIAGAVAVAVYFRTKSTKEKSKVSQSET